MKTTESHLLGIRTLPRGAAAAIFAEARDYKARRANPQKFPLKGQTWALMFSKPSTRTRVSFEVAIRELGGDCFFLNQNDIQLGRGEPIEDTARVLGRMVHGAVIRTFAQSDVENFSKYSRIPTINALTDEEHPCQVLTDIFTFEEKRGSILGKKVAFIGDAACNMGRSWVYAAEQFKFNLFLAAPAGFQSEISNSHTTLTDDPIEAAREADLVYTDVWVSMGMEGETEKRIAAFQGYQINRELLRHAHSAALVLHCLPAYRGKEISEEILEERADDIFDQAENRMHVQKGILHWLAHFPKQSHLGA